MATELDKLFDNAKSSFLATLTPEERGRFESCASADQVISDLEALHQMRPARRALPIISRIQGFNNVLEPYFKVIEIVCQSNPEWTCIAWGAFRLILQLATNFVTFFEKLSRLIERLTASLPQYAEYFELLCSGNSIFSLRLSNSLVRFYVDILDFFQAVAHVFSRPSGKLKRTPVVIADLLWCPFESRFQDIIERMKFHQAVLKDELDLAVKKSLLSKLDAETKRAEDSRLEAERHAKLSEETGKTLSELAQRTFLAAVISWLLPPPFKDSFEYAYDLRQDGTAEWLFHDSKYQAWMALGDATTLQPGSNSKGMLWVQGNPGWGKTVMAASAIEELRCKATSTGSSPIVCYYFFSQQDLAHASSAHVAAYRAIAAQIFQQCHQMEEIYNIYALANDGSNSTASENELRDLLNMVIPLLSDVYMVLDGLDEIADVDRLMADVRRVCENSSAKLLLFSRPHIAILREMLGPGNTITMSRGVMNTDIRVYVQNQLQSLGDQKRFPINANLRLAEDEIVKQADGMFLWAKLMFCYLKSPALTKSQRMSTIFDTTPVGLQQMYDRILSQITSMDDASVQLATTVFSWIVYAQEDLTAEECSDAVYCAPEQEDILEKKEFVDKAVIVVCCGLVEKRQNNTLRLIHLTAKDHLLSTKSKEQKTLILPPAGAHIEIASRCISYLLFTIPPQPLSGRHSTPALLAPLRRQYPLLCYSAKHWPIHVDSLIALCDSPTNGLEMREKMLRFFGLIEKFLAHPVNVTAWVEATYAFADGEPLFTINEVLNTFQRSAGAFSYLNEFSSTMNTLALFAHDLKQIHRQWGPILKTSPHEIWGDASSFTKSHFLFQNSGVAIETFAPTRDHHPSKCSDPIFCIGSKNGDGTLIGKLTIYPSCAFNDLWKRKPERFDQDWFHTFRDDAILHKFCRDWFAQYDIHRIGENSATLLTKYISLNPEEIALQMQFSLRLTPLRNWKLKFPMAISPDLSTVIVLRTIITAELQESQTRLFTHTPNFSGHEGLRLFWSKKAFTPDLPFRYEWVFSSDSCYAILRVRKLAPNHGSLAILGLNRSSLGIESHIVEYRKVNVDSGLPLCAIHPEEPKMLMLDYDTLIFKDLRTGLEINNNPIECFKITKLEFSQCGKYYILYYDDESRPHIHPLPWDSTSAGPSEAKSAVETHIEKKRKLDEVATGSFEMLLSTSHGAFESVGSSSTAVNAEANTVLRISTGAPQRIELKRHEKKFGKDSSCVLVTVPQDASVRNINATLIPLEQRDTKRVRIVLTPEIQDTYESDTTTISQHLPAVIDRDMATLTPGPAQTIGGPALSHLELEWASKESYLAPASFQEK